MLSGTSPKSKFVYQSKNSSFFKLVSCVVILLSLLTILQVFVIFNEPKIGKNELNIVEQNSSFGGLRLNSSSSSSQVTYYDDGGKIANNTARRLRRNDFTLEPLPEASSQEHLAEEPANLTISGLSKLLAAQDDIRNVTQDLDSMENMGTSETVNRGIMMIAAASKRSGGLNHNNQHNAVDYFRDVEKPERKVSERLVGGPGAGVDINRVISKLPPSKSRKPQPTPTITEAPETPSTGTIEEPQTGDVERESSGTVAQDELSLVGDDSLDEIRQLKPQSNQKLPLESNSYEMMSQIPDSMDSLMNSSEQEDLADAAEENNPSASHPIEHKRMELGSRKKPQSRKLLQPASMNKNLKDQDDDDIDLDLNDDINMDDRRRLPSVVAGPKQDFDKDLKVAAGYHHSKKKKKHHHHGHGHDHGHYYMYAKVPKKKSWEFGFKRGNKKHWIERHEKGHKNKFKTKVKWYDKKSKGKGVHIWDYNHHDKKKKHHYG